MSDRKKPTYYDKAEFIRKVESCGFCPFKIAKQAKMSHQAFYNLINGVASPTLKTCSRIMNAIWELKEAKK